MEDSSGRREKDEVRRGWRAEVRRGRWEVGKK